MARSEWDPETLLERKWDNGPAEGLPNTKVGTFPQALYDDAKKDGWIVISMTND
jgi:hypothetical protein